MSDQAAVDLITVDQMTVEVDADDDGDWRAAA
jgi:hypothetical protein